MFLAANRAKEGGPMDVLIGIGVVIFILWLLSLAGRTKKRGTIWTPTKVEWWE